MCSILESEVGPVFTGLCWFPMQIITLTREGPFSSWTFRDSYLHPALLFLCFNCPVFPASEIGKLLAEAQRWLLCDQPLC